MKPTLRLLAGLFIATTLAACSSTSTSTITPGAAAEQAWTGKVLVSEAALPAGVEHKVIGTVKANARAGYGSGDSLFPLLADEARKLGANGVIDVAGGRSVTMLSWSAPYVNGTAIKVEDPAVLQGMAGTSH